MVSQNDLDELLEPLKNQADKDPVATVATFKLKTRPIEDWLKLNTKHLDQVTIHHLPDGEIALFNQRNKMIYIMGTKRG